MLLAAERVGKHDRSFESAGPRDAVAVGFAQALALVPGVSRSGSTITAGLFLGLDRASAARFSFLLSVPAVVLSGLFETRRGVRWTTTPASSRCSWPRFSPSWSGYASIAFLLRFLAIALHDVFVAYRVVLGVVVLALTGRASSVSGH